MGFIELPIDLAVRNPVPLTTLLPLLARGEASQGWLKRKLRWCPSVSQANHACESIRMGSAPPAAHNAPPLTTGSFQVIVSRCRSPPTVCSTIASRYLLNRPQGSLPMRRPTSNAQRVLRLHSCAVPGSCCTYHDAGEHTTWWPRAALTLAGLPDTRIKAGEP
jgi:hypothetical protein